MSSTVLFYAFVVGILPAFVWLSFWLREDIGHPEPRWLIGVAFVSGAFSIIAAVLAEKAVSGIISDPTTLYASWAAIEEIIKMLVIACILQSRYYDEPIDAMIYAITVALGFSAAENALFMLGPLSQGAILAGFVTGGMRFIGASLVHIVSSALIGFAIGWTYYRSRLAEAGMLLACLSAGVALHAAFNLTIINSSPTETLRIFSWVWAAVVVLILLFEEVKAVRPRVGTP